ncbi:MAG: ribonuclease P protein component [Candidatus Shikimatogenerans sp. JK-2022]|nr:ribonuclease P protein component [Candidatus Shikimatogenerans bostrichidophilus]
MFLNKKEIKLIFKKGKFLKFYNNIIKIIFLKNKKKKNKISIKIFKKNIKKSVNRNKIKRRIYNSYKNNEKLLKFNYFIIFIYIEKKIINFKILNNIIKNIIFYINNETIFTSRFREPYKKI